MPVPGKLPKNLTVDFTGVERGGGGRSDLIDEGDYLFKVKGCEVRKKKDDPSRRHLAWTLQVQAPAEFKGKKVIHRTALSEESLWSLRGFLMDLLGEDNVPQSAVDIPLRKIVRDEGLIGGTVEHEEYNGKPQSKIAATFPASDWKNISKAQAAAAVDDDEDEDEDEDEEEAPPKAKKAKKTEKKSKKPVVEDDDEDEDEDDEDIDEIDTDDI